MPGIAGLITNLPRTHAEAQLKKMLDSVWHESFYNFGTWSDPSLGVYIGWVARKGSFSDNMPLLNENQDVVLIFSGEEYPHPATRQRLQQAGHVITAGGSRYLVHLYEEDDKFPANLNGRFHGVVIDRRRGRTLLFNDRYGMHRLCVYESDNAFYFAAEAKAIHAACPGLRKPDFRSLGELISCGCVLENRTIFEGIELLPQAAAWSFHKGRVQQKRSYFDPSEWETQTPLERDQYFGELRNVWSRNLGRYFNGSEQVGVSLTGGLDTRIIMAWHNSGPETLPCYTFGGMYRDCHDVQIARRIAGVCGQSHCVIEVGEEFLTRFPYYCERSLYFSEGGVDVYRAADLYVSEKARQIAPAKIVGTYGSEILRHAVMFKPNTPLSGLYDSEFSASIQQARNTYADIRNVHPVTFAAFRQSPWYHFGILGLEQTQLSVRSPYLDNDFVRTVYRAPKNLAPDDDVRVRLIKDGSPELAKIPTDRGVGGNSAPLVSLLRRNLLEFTFKAEYAYDYGMPQWLTRLDQMLSSLRLERLFLGRHKLLHFRLWYRSVLAQYIQQILLDERALSRPYLRRGMLEKIVNDHVGGIGNYTTEIHRLLTMELLHRLFFDAA